MASSLGSAPVPSEYETRTLAQLRAHGFRITMPRLAVIRVLATSGGALSAYAIHERVGQQGGRVDVVTVYRILDTLLEIHAVHHIGALAGYIACRLPAEHEGQMEHAICTTCGRVDEVCVSDTLRDAATAPAAEHGFRPDRLTIEVLGQCVDCQTKRP